MMKKEMLILLFVVFFVEIAFAQLADSAWPTFNGNNQRTGLSPYDTSYIDGTIKWVYQTDATIGSSAAIGEDGTIYVGMDDGYFYAFDPDNGEIKWKTKIGTPLVKDPGNYEDYTSTLTSPAIAKDGTIYTASRDQFLFAFNPDGTEKWKLPLDVVFDNWGSPAIADDGTIYMTSSNPRPGVIAVNPDGTEKWFFPAGANMFNSVSIGKDGIIYAALPKSTQMNTIYALSPENGEVIWEVDTHLFIESTLTVTDDGTVYGGTFAKEGPGFAGVYAVKNGEILWYFETESSTETMSTPSIAKDGTIYFGADDGIFYALNPDGTEKWQYVVDGLIESSPSIGNEGTIYFGVSTVPEGSSSFFALNPDGTLKWKNFENANSIMASASIGKDGSIYVGSFGGSFYAFGKPEDGKAVDEKSLEKTIINGSDNWTPEEAGIDCSKTKSEECDMYCHDNSDECPDYFGEDNNSKKGFFTKIVDWFKKLFS